MLTSIKNAFRSIWVAIQPFFDIKGSGPTYIVSLGVSVLVLGLILFQAVAMDITYDEAYTYIHTGQLHNFWSMYQFRVANTHIVNSLLMVVTTLFLPYLDFALRAPSVFFGVFYIGISLSISKQYTNKLLVLGGLLLFYYLILYFSLARGYSMSTTSILAMFYIYKNQEKFSPWYVWFSGAALVAIYANYIAIPIVSIFGLYIFIFDFKFKMPPFTHKSKILLGFLYLLGLYGFYSVTQEGKPLYGAYNESFLEAIPADTWSRFISNPQFESNLVLPITVAIVTLIVLGIGITRGKNVAGVVLLATLTGVTVLSTVAGKPLPTGRILLPFWPLVVFSIIEVIEWGTQKLGALKKWMKPINWAIFALLVLNFYQQIPFQHLNHTLVNHWERAILPMRNYETGFMPQNLYYSHHMKEDYRGRVYPQDIYYIEKEQMYHLVWSKINTQSPKEVIKNELGTWKYYAEINLVTLQLNAVPPSGQFTVKLLHNGEVEFTRDYEVNLDELTQELKYPLIFPLPSVFNGNHFEVVYNSKDRVTFKVESPKIQEGFQMLPPLS